MNVRLGYLTYDIEQKRRGRVDSFIRMELSKANGVEINDRQPESELNLC
jgi:hypothetical protein